MTTILFVVITTPLLLEQIKSVEISDFIYFKSLLILAVCMLDCVMTLSLFILMGTIICFLNISLAVMFSLSLSF